MPLLRPSEFNPEWVEFPTACGATGVDTLDTPLLAAGRFIQQRPQKISSMKSGVLGLFLSRFYCFKTQLQRIISSRLIMCFFLLFGLPPPSVFASVIIDISNGNNITPSLSDEAGYLPFALVGNGFLTVTGTSTYAGTTTIGGATGSGGNLFIPGGTPGGSIGSTGTAFVINPSGSLYGGGTIKGILSNSGVISPSNNNNADNNSNAPSIPIGQTMTVQGSFTQEISGVTQLYVNPTISDRIDISGNADLSNGHIYITPMPGTYPEAGVTYTMITWGSSTNTPVAPILTTPSIATASYTITGPVNGLSSMNVTLFSIGRTVNTDTDISDLLGITGTIFVENDAVIGSSAAGTTSIPNRLTIQSSTTLSITPIANATMEFTGPITGDINSVIALTGEGNSSILSISGDGTGFEGTIQANNARLIINSTTPAYIDIQDHAILSGTGSVGAVTVETGGILKPGNSIGTTTYHSLNTHNHAHYQVEMNTTNANKINVTNNATLGSNFNVDVLMDGDTYVTGTTPFTIMTYGTLTGNPEIVTWWDQPGYGLNFDTEIDTTNKEINLIRTITTNFTIGADQTAPGLISRRIITNTSEDLSNLTNYKYITLNNGEITNKNNTPELKAAIKGTGNITLDEGTTTLSGDNSLLTAPVTVNNNAALFVTQNLGSGKLTLNNTSSVTFSDNASIENNDTILNDNSKLNFIILAGNKIKIADKISGSIDSSIVISGDGEANFSVAQILLSNLLSTITINHSTVNVQNGSSLGCGTVILENSTAPPTDPPSKPPPKLVLGNIDLPNPISANAVSTFKTDSSLSSPRLTGSITGTHQLVFDGPGTITIEGDSPNYTKALDGTGGTLSVTGGTLIVNSNLEHASVEVSNGATFSGAGTVGDVVMNSGGIYGSGNTTEKLNVNSWTDNTSTYNLYITPTGEINTIVSENNVTLNNPTLNVFMNAGTYQGVIDYPVFEAGGSLTITNNTTINYVNTNPGGINPATLTAGTLTQTSGGVTKNYLVLKATLSETLSVASNQTDMTDQSTTTYNGDLPSITIQSTDIFATDSGLKAMTSSTRETIAEQVELTSLVFDSNSSSVNDPTSSATADSFRFKKLTQSSSQKGLIESLITEISKNGPVSFEGNQKRLWITPFVNRSRVNVTDSSSGNQGWSGGTLVGFEQRDQKDMWAFGVLTGLMGSRSHLIGKPSTYTKTNGVLLGAYNSLKYTRNKQGGNFGHELLVSRTFTGVNAQRDGIDAVNQVTPFYAMSTHKTKTDIGNGQINYLFDVVKKFITCRLNTGMTYIGTHYGAYSESGAGTNGINESASKHKSYEWYNGIGIRTIWNHEKFTLRTTFVYEYGYQAKSTGTIATATTQSQSPTSFTTPPGPRQNKHYIKLSTSFLDHDSGLKFIASYSGVLYKNVTNHTAMFKVEYRF